VGDANVVFGVWQSANLPKGWTQIPTIPAGELNQISTNSADPNTGNVYIGFGDSGRVYLPETVVA
jgi:hypothetical protein